MVSLQFSICTLIWTVKTAQVTYQLKCLIEHHGETINRGHCTATIEEEGRWLNCNALVFKRTRLQIHLSNGYMLFYVHM